MICILEVSFLHNSCSVNRLNNAHLKKDRRSNTCSTVSFTQGPHLASTLYHLSTSHAFSDARPELVAGGGNGSLGLCNKVQMVNSNIFAVVIYQISV